MATANRKGFPDFPMHTDQIAHGRYRCRRSHPIIYRRGRGEAGFRFTPDQLRRHRVVQGPWLVGQFANAHPNEALEWAGIQWAKAAGYRYYDLEGINLRDAEYAIRGEPIPDELADAPSTTPFSLRSTNEMVAFGLRNLNSFRGFTDWLCSSRTRIIWIQVTGSMLIAGCSKQFGKRQGHGVRSERGVRLVARTGSIHASAVDRRCME